MAISLAYFSFNFFISGNHLVWFFRRRNWKFVRKTGGVVIMVAKKLIYYILPLVFIVLVVMWIWGPEAAWSGMKGAVKGVIEMAPNVTIGAEEIRAKKIQVPKEVEKTYINLYSALERAKESRMSKCVIQYDELSNLKDFKIALNYLDGKMILNLMTKKDQFVTELRKEIDGLKPCIVGGISGTVGHPEAAYNFFYNWIDPRIYPKKKEFKTPEYNWFKDRIVIMDKETLVAAGREYDLEDEGLTYIDKKINLLYKANDDAVCFLVTHDGDTTCEDTADEDGVDDDCLEEFLPTGKLTIDVCR